MEVGSRVSTRTQKWYKSYRNGTNPFRRSLAGALPIPDRDLGKGTSPPQASVSSSVQWA